MKLFKPEDCDAKTTFINDIGQKITISLPSNAQPMISLARANEIFEKWLAKGTDVWCKQNGDSMNGNVQTWQNSTRAIYGSQATHTARIVCVEAIEQDSAEKVLADLIRYEDYRNPGEIEALCERARKLQEKK